MPNNKPIARKADLIDIHIGRRIRTRRLECKLSQSDMGDRLRPPVTWQQVQKYEKGGNRLNATRLHQLCAILAVPITYFFDGAPASGTRTKADPSRPSPDALSEIMATADGIRIAKSLIRIASPVVRHKVAAALATMAEAVSEPPAQAAE